MAGLLDWRDGGGQCWDLLLAWRHSPLIAAPVALGTLIGALVGARVLARLSNKILRIIFLAVIVVAAVEMVLRGIGIA